MPDPVVVSEKGTTPRPPRRPAGHLPATDGPQRTPDTPEGPRRRQRVARGMAVTLAHARTCDNLANVLSLLGAFVATAMVMAACWPPG